MSGDTAHRYSLASQISLSNISNVLLQAVIYWAGYSCIAYLNNHFSMASDFRGLANVLDALHVPCRFSAYTYLSLWDFGNFVGYM